MGNNSETPSQKKTPNQTKPNQNKTKQNKTKQKKTGQVRPLTDVRDLKGCPYE